VSRANLQREKERERERERERGERARERERERAHHYVTLLQEHAPSAPHELPHMQKGSQHNTLLYITSHYFTVLQEHAPSVPHELAHTWKIGRTWDRPSVCVCVVCVCVCVLMQKHTYTHSCKTYIMIVQKTHLMRLVPHHITIIHKLAAADGLEGTGQNHELRRHCFSV
jgi:hypothetical protein